MKTIILLSSIACTCITAADTKKSYLPWVKEADTIYIYSARGIFLAEVPITQNPTLDSVKKCLKKVLHATVDYSLHPLYNETWRLGRWHYGDAKLSPGKIKDTLEQHDTDRFWIRIKPRKPHQS